VVDDRDDSSSRTKEDGIIASTLERSFPTNPSPIETIESVFCPATLPVSRRTAGPAIQTLTHVSSPVESAVPHPRECPKIPYDDGLSDRDGVVVRYARTLLVMVDRSSFFGRRGGGGVGLFGGYGGVGRSE